MAQMQLRHLQWIVPALYAVASTMLPLPAFAQEFPGKPITVIVPFGAGSGTDIACRVFNKGAEEYLKGTMIVDNRPGGAATVAVAYVARATPDGYTLLCLGGGSASKTFRKDMSVDLLTDLTPVVQITQGSMYLMVHGDLPVKNAQDFVELMRRNPGKYNYGYIASTQMMPMEVLKDKTGVKLVGIPYKGLAGVQQAIASGDVVAYVGNQPGLQSMFSSGKLKLLAVLGNERNPFTPDVPAAPEVGLSGVLAPYTQGYWAPAKTPADIVNRLNAAFNASLKTPPAQDYLKNQSARPTGGAPRVQLDAIRAEHAYWAEAARISKFEPE